MYDIFKTNCLRFSRVPVCSTIVTAGIIRGPTGNGPSLPTLSVEMLFYVQSVHFDSHSFVFLDYSVSALLVSWPAIIGLDTITMSRPLRPIKRLLVANR